MDDEEGLAASAQGAANTEATSVPWFADLMGGAGVASGLPEPLRDVLIVATVDRALEGAAAARREAQARERAEAARVAAERQREADAARVRANAAERALAARRRRFSSAYAKIVGTTVVTCATVLVPLLIGRHTRDSMFRPHDPNVFNTSVRQNGAYFKADFLAGCSWVIGAAALVLLVIALVGRRVRLNAAFAVAAVAIFAGGYALTTVSEKVWDVAESASAVMLDTSGVPPSAAPCPGRALDMYDYELHESGGFSWNSVLWRVELRELTDRDDAGNAEVGACFYSGWNYVTTVSFGVVTDLNTRQGGFRLAEYGDTVGVYFDTHFDEIDSGTVYGVNLAAIPAPSSGPLPLYFAGQTPAAGADSPYVTTTGAWAIDLSIRGRTRIQAGLGPYLVAGPWLNGDVFDLLAIGPDGTVATLASSTFNDAYSFEGGVIAVLLGATEDTGGYALDVLGPDLQVAREMSCPDGGAIWYRNYLDAFACGTYDHFRAVPADGTWYDYDTRSYILP